VAGEAAVDVDPIFVHSIAAGPMRLIPSSRKGELVRVGATNRIGQVRSVSGEFEVLNEDLVRSTVAGRRKLLVALGEQQVKRFNWKNAAVELLAVFDDLIKQ